MSGTSGLKQRLLITGGTGFLGASLVPALRDRFEVWVSGRNPGPTVPAGASFHAMDVTDAGSVEDAFRAIRPAHVVHAAAMKSVADAEQDPLGCIDVNVLGSANVARAAVRSGARTVVGISSDKASPPVRSVYGSCKAVMERAFCSMDSATGTRFCCARIGSIAWTPGSVLACWARQFEENRVLRVTEPEMTRFFFTGEDAAGLVVTCIDRMDELGGAVVTRRMKAARFRDLLDAWTSEWGGRWEKTPSRPGDRLQEFQVGASEVELASREDYGGIPHYVIRLESPAGRERLRGEISSDNAERMSRQELLALIAPGMRL